MIWEESIDERPWEKARSRYDNAGFEEFLSAELGWDDFIRYLVFAWTWRDVWTCYVKC